MNLYTYAYNNPLIYHDPSGHTPEWVDNATNWVTDGWNAYVTWGEELEYENHMRTAKLFLSVRGINENAVNYQQEFLKEYNRSKQRYDNAMNIAIACSLSGPTKVGSSKIFFGQKGVSSNFSKGGKFKGASIESIADKLKNGMLSPDDLPIEYVVREGKMITLNNRSLTALSKAGLNPTTLINKTGNQFFEKQITERLAEMGGQPSTSMFIRKIKEIVHLP